MPDVDVFARSYLFVDVHRDAGADAVAELFEAAAAALRQHGEIDVHHVVFETDTGAHRATTSVTIYYDRVERRRYPRTDATGQSSGSTPSTPLHPVE